MALEKQFGIGQGEAQVINLNPLMKTLGDQAERNRQKNAKRQAEKATKAATLNALDDKLKVEGHHSHNKYLQESLTDLKTWANEQYAEHGESAFVDKPDLKSEWEGKINNFVGLNQASKNIKGALQSQIDRSMNNEFEMDRASVQEFNDYMSLPLDEQMQRPLPAINERELTANELFKKGGYDDLMDNTAKDFGYDTTPDDGGEYKSISGTNVDAKQYSEARDVILANPESPYYRAVAEEQAQALSGSGLIPEKIRDESGEMIDNPVYLDVLNERIKIRTEELMDAHAPKEKIKTSRKYTPQRAIEDDETTLTPIDAEDAGFRVKEKLDVIDEGGKYSEYIGEALTSDDGTLYVKTKKAIYTNKNGDLTFNKEDGVGAPIPAGTIIDKSGRMPSDDVQKELKAFRKVTTKRSGDWSSVKTKEVADLSSASFYIDSEGKKIKISGEEGFEKARVSEIVEDAKYKESKGQLVFEGDEDYKKTKGREKTGDFIKVKTSKGSDFKTIPYNDEAKSKYPELEKKRKAQASGRKTERLTGQDKEAYDWAINNPDDSRSKKILNQLGI